MKRNFSIRVNLLILQKNLCVSPGQAATAMKGAVKAVTAGAFMYFAAAAAGRERERANRQSYKSPNHRHKA
jgi:hypothetical protein